MEVVTGLLEAPTSRWPGVELAAHLRDLAGGLEAAKQFDRAAELRRLGNAIEAEVPAAGEVRGQCVRAIEAVSLGVHPRSVANGSRVRLHQVGTGLPCRCPRVARHRAEGRRVEATGEVLVWHRPGCDVEP